MKHYRVTRTNRQRCNTIRIGYTHRKSEYENGRAQTHHALSYIYTFRLHTKKTPYIHTQKCSERIARDTRERVNVGDAKFNEIVSAEAT